MESEDSQYLDGESQTESKIVLVHRPDSIRTTLKLRRPEALNQKSDADPAGVRLWIALGPEINSDAVHRWLLCR